MVHPYPARCASFCYRGRSGYLLTFPTHQRLPRFVNAATVEIALAQILRAAAEKRFDILAYCFMPDHLHMVVQGVTEQADCKEFVKLSKQYSGYGYSQANGRARLWQRYSHDNIARDDAEVVNMVRYVVANPVEAGLVTAPEEYPFLGSQHWSVAQLLDWCREPSPVLQSGFHVQVEDP
jgi:putative transposase